MGTANKINPEATLGSIVRSLPLTPARKLAGLLALCPDLERGTQADLAEALGRDKVHLNMVVKGRRPSESLKQGIAEFLGVRVRDIWPSEDESLPPTLPFRTPEHHQNPLAEAR